MKIFILIQLTILLTSLSIGQSNRVLQFPKINCLEVFQFLEETNSDEEEIILFDGLTVYHDSIEGVQVIDLNVNLNHLNFGTKKIRGLTIGSNLVHLCKKREVLYELDSICNYRYNLSFNDIINRGILDESKLIHDDVKRLCNFDEDEALLFDFRTGQISKSDFFSSIDRNNTSKVTFITVNPIYENIEEFKQLVFIPRIIYGIQGRKNRCNKIKNYDKLRQFDLIDKEYLSKKIYLNYWGKAKTKYFQNSEFLLLKNSCSAI